MPLRLRRPSKKPSFPNVVSSGSGILSGRASSGVDGKLVGVRRAEVSVGVGSKSVSTDPMTVGSTEFGSESSVGAGEPTRSVGSGAAAVYVTVTISMDGTASADVAAGSEASTETTAVGIAELRDAVSMVSEAAAESVSVGTAIAGGVQSPPPDEVTTPVIIGVTIPGSAESVALGSAAVAASPLTRVSKGASTEEV